MEAGKKYLHDLKRPNRLENCNNPSIMLYLPEVNEKGLIYTPLSWSREAGKEEE